MSGITFQSDHDKDDCPHVIMILSNGRAVADLGRGMDCSDAEWEELRNRIQASFPQKQIEELT